MSVAIVHYHLSHGGVTRVLENTSQMLTEAGVPHVILVGSPPERDCQLPYAVVEGLNYLPESNGGTPLQLVHAMRAAVQEKLGLEPVTWHFHNHALGVNCLLAEAIGILAEAGERMVLQLHDLAEDGRPRNYPMVAACDTLYPIAPQIRYAFLNSRDRSIFHNAGLPPEQSFLLPNSITPPAHATLPSDPPNAPLVLYPVRGIRRKNLGELFLLATLAPAGTRFAVTLEPVHPRWKSIHDDWIAFARDTKLGVEFNVAGQHKPTPNSDTSFAAWVGASTHWITTSVAEGFGLGFLESVAMGKPLIGRNLPTVTCDYLAAGIAPGRLYERILVPESWVGLETLRQRLVRCASESLEHYDAQLSSSHIDQIFDALRFHGHLDFGNLPEDLQRQVIHRLLAGDGREEVLVEIDGQSQPAKTWLADVLSQDQPTATPDQLEPYSPTSSLHRLKSLYADLAAATPAKPAYLPKHKVLNQYLQPDAFHFLLT